MSAAGHVRPSVGQSLPVRIIESVDPEKMKLLSALMRDPNPIHFDRASVRALGMGDRTINQGPSNMAYVLSMLGEWAGGVDRIRHYRFRFSTNVVEGDRLVASGTVTAVRELAVEDTVAGLPGAVEVECALSLAVVDGASVLTGTALVIL